MSYYICCTTQSCALNAHILSTVSCGKCSVLCCVVNFAASWLFENVYLLQTARAHCNALHHTATHCNTLQRAASQCNTLQHTAPYAAAYCSTHCMSWMRGGCLQYVHILQTYWISALQHNVTHCNTLQHNADFLHQMQCVFKMSTYCRRTESAHCNALHRTATHCNTLPHTATHCNTLQIYCMRCSLSTYGVLTISRLLKIIGLFCKGALLNWLHSAKETCKFKEPGLLIVANPYVKRCTYNHSDEQNLDWDSSTRLSSRKKSGALLTICVQISSWCEWSTRVSDLTGIRSEVTKKFRLNSKTSKKLYLNKAIRMHGWAGTCHARSVKGG